MTDYNDGLKEMMCIEGWVRYTWIISVAIDILRLFGEWKKLEVQK